MATVSRLNSTAYKLLEKIKLFIFAFVKNKIEGKKRIFVQLWNYKVRFSRLKILIFILEVLKYFCFSFINVFILFFLYFICNKSPLIKFQLQCNNSTLLHILSHSFCLHLFLFLVFFSCWIKIKNMFSEFPLKLYFISKRKYDLPFNCM